MTVKSEARASIGDVLDQRLIGPHLPLGPGLLKAAARAQEIGATAIQVFTDNPTAWRRRATLPPDLAEFRARLAASGIGPLSVHAPYLVNLCATNEPFWSQSVATMSNELRVGASYGARFVVMHIGSHRGIGRNEGIARLILGLAQILEDTALGEAGGQLPRLVLENAAGTGDGIGSTIEDLADISQSAQIAGLPLERLGFCLDTAHLWGAGIDVGTADKVDRVVERFDELIGLEQLVMLHLNDSRADLGSLVDRHEHIGAGTLGAQGIRGVLDHPALAGLPTYLETPAMDHGFDAVNLDRVQMVLAGETLPELPPEAFTRRGSRSRGGAPLI